MMLIQAARTRVRHADITRRTRHDWTHASAGQETQGLHRRRSRRTCLHPLAPTRRDHHHLAGLLRIPHRLAHRHRIHPAVFNTSATQTTGASPSTKPAPGPTSTANYPTVPTPAHRNKPSTPHSASTSTTPQPGNLNPRRINAVLH